MTGNAPFLLLPPLLLLGIRAPVLASGNHDRKFMSSPSEDKLSTGEMTLITEPVGRKDETYHWFDNVEFLVSRRS